MKIQKIVSDYFHFTKRERIALLAFFGLVLITLIYRIALNFQANPYLKLELQNIPLPIDVDANNQVQYSPASNSYNVILSSINPNNASFNELTAIGFTTKQAAIILNYRKKGGLFIHKEDLLKIYSVDSISFNKVEKWIELPIKLTVTNHINTQTKIASKKEKEPIDLNAADSIALLSIYGIGPYLAHQIINYRNQLGGFINVEQLQEIKGMHSDNYASINTRFYIKYPHKGININTAELKTLALHPYSSWQLAKLIINYRKQHGPFQQISELKNIYGIEESNLSKISPYLYID